VWCSRCSLRGGKSVLSGFAGVLRVAQHHYQLLGYCAAGNIPVIAILATCSQASRISSKPEGRIHYYPIDRVEDE